MSAFVRSLRHASQSFPDPKKVVEDGLDISRIHRGNYIPTYPDPKCLQIVWSPKHWIDLKDGSSMHFLKEPIRHILPNADLTPEQKTLAGEFVDELINLGVFYQRLKPRKLLPMLPCFGFLNLGSPDSGAF
jgi:hypothetical protein